MCDWIKERQFLRLRDEINNQTVTVYRGAYGTVTQIPVRDIVVGDIVHLNEGDRVPADCIILNEMKMKVDESLYFPHRVNPTSKEESQVWLSKGKLEDNHKKHPDPFLFTDTKVMEGQGRAIVCCVGQNTVLARIRKPEDLVINEQQTDLEKKLERTSQQIAKYAIFATVISVVTHLIFNMACILFTSNQLFSNATLLQLLEVGIYAVVLMIVAIPEGLPIAVSIAMALSINRLKKD